MYWPTKWMCEFMCKIYIYIYQFASKKYSYYHRSELTTYAGTHTLTYVCPSSHLVVNQSSIMLKWLQGYALGPRNAPKHDYIYIWNTFLTILHWTFVYRHANDPPTPSFALYPLNTYPCNKSPWRVACLRCQITSLKSVDLLPMELAVKAKSYVQCFAPANRRHAVATDLWICMNRCLWYGAEETERRH